MNLSEFLGTFLLEGLLLLGHQLQRVAGVKLSPALLAFGYPGVTAGYAHLTPGFLLLLAFLLGIYGLD